MSSLLRGDFHRRHPATTAPGSGADTGWNATPGQDSGWNRTDPAPADSQPGTGGTAAPAAGRAAATAGSS